MLPSGVPTGHWLSYAVPDYSGIFVSEVRILMGVLLCFVPVSLFWALFDQQFSRWTYQAIMMNGRISLFGVTFNIKPEQMGVANAILILILIPIFDRIVYPLLAKVRLPLRPLARMASGMILAIISFIMAAFLQFSIESRGTFKPDPTDPATTICTSGCVHVLAQLPQYFVITCGEIMVSITGLEFAYSQAPASMKSVCQAAWLLSVALGNLVVMFVNEIDIAKRIFATHVMVWNFLLWALILALGTIGFFFIARRYKYVDEANRANNAEHFPPMQSIPSHPSLGPHPEDDTKYASTTDLLSLPPPTHNNATSRGGGAAAGQIDPSAKKAL